MDYSDRENESDEDELVNDVLDSNDFFNNDSDESEDKQNNDNDREEENFNKVEEKIKEKKLKPKRIVKNPRVTLNLEALRGPNGLSALKKMFTGFQFRGSNHEKEDLIKIMNIIQQWVSFKLCPSFEFESSLSQLEALGRKKVVQTLMKKYRMGINDWGERKSDSEEITDKVETEETNFDNLLQNETISVDINMELSQNKDDDPPVEQQQTKVTLTQEQLERIARNRKLAEERRMKRMSEYQAQNKETDVQEKASEFQLDKID